MLIAVRDEGSVKMTREGYQALSLVAAEDITSLDVRDSFALIGYTGKEKPSFVKQVCHELEKCFFFIGLINSMQLYVVYLKSTANRIITIDLSKLFTVIFQTFWQSSDVNSL